MGGSEAVQDRVSYIYDRGKCKSLFLGVTGEGQDISW
jgi:hypothetical protein